MAPLHLATRVFLTGNHITDDQQDEEQDDAFDIGHATI